MTSIVLIGGKSLRLGQDKAGLMLGGESLMQRIISCLAPFSAEIIVVTSEGQASPSLSCSAIIKTVTDLYPGKSSLGGIYSGLMASASFHNLVVACDMPLLNVALLGYMISLSPTFDVVIPRLRGTPESLHAVYSKNCLGPIERQLKQDRLKITDFFNQVKVRYVEEAEIDNFDIEHLSFFNINTEADLEKAKQLLNRGKSQ